jgi:hypothetical protein
LFTALITRDLKRKYDKEYQTYKDGLCDIAEVDPEHVKAHMLTQAKDFFKNIRT